MPDNRVPIMDMAIEHELKKPASSSKPRRSRRADFLSSWPPSRRTASPRTTRSASGARAPYRALDGLTLAVEPGEVFGFLGPNGAGKTTTLKLLMQLVYPTSGTRRDPGPPARRPRREAAHRLPAREPVLLRLPDRRGAARRISPACSAIPAPNGAQRASRLLDEVGIGAERRLQLRKFSKGMLQRVGIAQALINDPEVVFLDEPMSGLDPLGRRDIRALILRLRDRGCTVFFSSHVLSDAEALCSRVAIVAKGRLMASGTLSEISRFQIARLGAGMPPRAAAAAAARRSRARARRSPPRRPAATRSTCRSRRRRQLLARARGAGAQLCRSPRCATRSRTSSSAR